jgi:outer membrane protein assembly factor BamB
MKMKGCFSWVAGAQLVLLVLLSGGQAAAADWPQWRGPERDGVSAEAGLLKQWPAGGPPLVWKATGLGGGFSSVSLVGDRIFTMGDKEGASYVVALSRGDGKVLWSAKAGRGGAPGWGGFAGTRATPTVDDGLVYALGQYGEILCVRASDGKEVWHKHMTDDFGGGRPEWGFAESPLVDGEKVLLTPGGPMGTVAALNKMTGAVLWRSQEWTDPAHYSSIIVAEIGGVRQYLQLTEKNLAGLAVSDGKVLWKARRKGAVAVIPTPICSGNQVYVTSGYGIGCNLFTITPNQGAFSAEEVYANKVMANHHGGVVKVGDYLYGYSEDKGWTCQRFKTGEAIWAENPRLGKGSVTCAEGLLYCRDEVKGTVALVEASPDGYKERGRFVQPDRGKEKSWPHPVVAGGRLYLRDQDQLFCYDLQAK